MHLPAGSDAGVCALVPGVPAELSKHRGDDGRARSLRRSFHAASLVDEDPAGARGDVSPAQARGGAKLANGRDLRQGRRAGGQWKYLYRAVDGDGDTIDFLLRAKRDRAAARAFFERAIDLRGVPGKITIDKSGSDSAAIVSIQADRGLCIEMRQSKYLDNIVEQDHRAVKRITRPILGLKSFRCARILLAVIEVMHMIRKGRLSAIQDPASSAASQFYSLAF
jgi:putative transposase